MRRVPDGPNDLGLIVGMANHSDGTRAIAIQLGTARAELEREDAIAIASGLVALVQAIDGDPGALYALPTIDATTAVRADVDAARRRGVS